MHQSVHDGELVVRDTVLDLAPADMRFCFSRLQAVDAGSLASGDLFKQDGDFYIFDVEVDEVTRAGPSMVSPNRCYGYLKVSFLTKGDAEFTGRRNLEKVADWFAQKTIEGVRFRVFQPAGTYHLLGFTLISGVINFDHEVYKEVQ